MYLEKAVDIDYKQKRTDWILHLWGTLLLCSDVGLLLLDSNKTIITNTAVIVITAVVICLFIFFCPFQTYFLGTYFWQKIMVKWSVHNGMPPHVTAFLKRPLPERWFSQLSLLSSLPHVQIWFTPLNFSCGALLKEEVCVMSVPIINLWT